MLRTSAGPVDECVEEKEEDEDENLEEEEAKDEGN